MSLGVGKEVKKYAWSVDFAVSHFRESSLYECDGGKYSMLIESMIKVMQDWSTRWSQFEISKSFLNHRSFLSEMEEAVVPIQTLLDLLHRRPESKKDPIVVVDLCSGKGFLSLMLSYLASELPVLRQHIQKILMVDSCFGRGKNSINTDYLNVVETDRTAHPKKIPVGCVSGNVFDPWFVRSLLTVIRGPQEYMSDITAAPVFKDSFTLTDIKKRLPIETLREMLAGHGEDANGAPEDIRARLLSLCEEKKPHHTGLDAWSRRFEFSAGADSMSGFLVKGSCRDWNRGGCTRKYMCKFKHVCAHCAAHDHAAVQCPLLPDFTKQAIVLSKMSEDRKSQSDQQSDSSLSILLPREPFVPRGLVPALPLAYMLEIAESQPLQFARCSSSELRRQEIAYIEIGEWFIVAQCISNQESVVQMLLPECPKYVQADAKMQSIFHLRTIELSAQIMCFRLTFSILLEPPPLPPDSCFTAQQTSIPQTSISFKAESDSVLAQASSVPLSTVTPPTMEIVFLGVHLCQRLSPRCVEIFNSVPSASLLVLAPCCLPPRNMAPMTLGTYNIDPVVIQAAKHPFEVNKKTPHKKEN